MSRVEPVSLGTGMSLMVTARSLPATRGGLDLAGGTLGAASFPSWAGCARECKLTVAGVALGWIEGASERPSFGSGIASVGTDAEAASGGGRSADVTVHTSSAAVFCARAAVAEGVRAESFGGMAGTVTAGTVSVEQAAGAFRPVELTTRVSGLPVEASVP